jgi:hypothetical protein
MWVNLVVFALSDGFGHLSASNRTDSVSRSINFVTSIFILHLDINLMFAFVCKVECRYPYYFYLLSLVSEDKLLKWLKQRKTIAPSFIQSLFCY